MHGHFHDTGISSTFNIIITHLSTDINIHNKQIYTDININIHAILGLDISISICYDVFRNKEHHPGVRWETPSLR